MVIKFRSPDATVNDIIFFRQPLGIDFDQTTPIVVKDVHPGSHAAVMGVKIGWTVLGVNSESVIGQGYQQVFSKLVAAECVLSKEVRAEALVPSRPPTAPAAVAFSPRAAASQSAAASLSAQIGVQAAPPAQPSVMFEFQPPLLAPPGSVTTDPAACSEGEAAGDVSGARCPRGHDLLFVRAYIWGTCDRCSINVDRGDVVGECPECSPVWWLCDGCRQAQGEATRGGVGWKSTNPVVEGAPLPAACGRDKSQAEEEEELEILEAQESATLDASSDLQVPERTISVQTIQPDTARTSVPAAPSRLGQSYSSPRIFEENALAATFVRGQNHCSAPNLHRPELLAPQLTPLKLPWDQMWADADLKVQRSIAEAQASRQR